MLSPSSRIAAALSFVLMAVVATPSFAARGLPDFTGLVEQNRAMVVNISTSQKRKVVSPRHRLPKGFKIPDLPKDSPFNEFFRRFFGEGQIEERNTQSLGSGFIISADGYVITNNHVVQYADEIIVRLSDRREFKAKLVGADKRSDIALLKIDATGLPTARLGTNYDLKVGEWVLAIGSPFGFDYSVTAGIVSAKGRSLPSENYVPFIQTDVAINPGNSGGPLFNLNGEVVGVNSQIFSRTGGFMGLSLAIPIDVAVNVVDQLKKNGRVSRGWLGVLIQDVTRELAESFGLDKPHGALVAKVLEDSPAARAGIKVGDVVLAFDGKRVDHSADLPPIVGGTTVGTRVPVEVRRHGRTLTLYVKTAELPGDDKLREAANSRPGSAVADNLGLSVSELSDAQRKELNLAQRGVVVDEVSDGPARDAGIRKGDIILMIGGRKVVGVSQFKQTVDDLPAGKAVSILVQRQGNPIFLALKPRE